MARNPKSEKIQCRYFQWRLFQRAGVHYADGRGCRQELGKQSLNTRNRAEAQAALRQLDKRMAVKLGLADDEVDDDNKDGIVIEQGWKLFIDDRSRPEVLGGIGERSVKRYRAVRDKHIAFCRTAGVVTWAQVDRESVLKYGAMLERKLKAAPATILFELNNVASVSKFLIERKRIAASCRFSVGLPKILDSDTYGYRREEVAAMMEFCRSDPELEWLRWVIIGLATTGMRIGELAGLRWADIDFDANVVKLTDERFSHRRNQIGHARKIKGKRSRSLPLNEVFRETLERIPHHSDGLVFHGPRGGRLKPDVVRSVLIREVIEPLAPKFPTPAGEIGFADGRLHSFRHFFVSEAFRLGVPEARIMLWVGHRDSRIVARYRHLRDDDGQSTMQRLNFFGSESNSVGPNSKA